MASWKEELASFFEKYPNQTAPEKALRKMVSRLASVGNKRLKSFEKHGIRLRPPSGYNDYGGNSDLIADYPKFGARGKDMGELRAEFKRATNFLQGRMGTVKQQKGAYKEFERTTRKKRNEEQLTKEQFEEAWEKNKQAFVEVGMLFQAMREGEWLGKGPKWDYAYSSSDINNYFYELVSDYPDDSIEELITRIKKEWEIDEYDDDIEPETSSTSVFF